MDFNILTYHPELLYNVYPSHKKYFGRHHDCTVLCISDTGKWRNCAHGASTSGQTIFPPPCLTWERWVRCACARIFLLSILIENLPALIWKNGAKHFKQHSWNIQILLGLARIFHSARHGKVTFRSWAANSWRIWEAKLYTSTIWYEAVSPEILHRSW